jgi:transcription initiation factor IIE alpha subunit
MFIQTIPNEIPDMIELIEAIIEGTTFFSTAIKNKTIAIPASIKKLLQKFY